jgi:hypothetical protein
VGWGLKNADFSLPFREWCELDQQVGLSFDILVCVDGKFGIPGIT